MSYTSAVIGKVSVEQRFPGENTCDWSIAFSARLSDKQKQALMNFAGSVNGISTVKHHRQNVYLVTVTKTTADLESECLKELILRFIKVVDKADQQLRETPLAVHSTVPIYGHHDQS